jgi:hypothetical protein
VKTKVPLNVIRLVSPPPRDVGRHPSPIYEMGSTYWKRLIPSIAALCHLSTWNKKWESCVFVRNRGRSGHRLHVISAAPRGVRAPARGGRDGRRARLLCLGGVEFVGVVGGRQMYIGPGVGWLVCDPFRLEHLHGWERGHPDGRRTAVRNDGPNARGRTVARNE